MDIVTLSLLFFAGSALFVLVQVFLLVAYKKLTDK